MVGCPQPPWSHRILHLLFPILFLQRPLCKWREGMTDLWYDCPTFVLTACPQFAIKKKRHDIQPRNNPAVHSVALASPVETCPDLTWPNPAWKSSELLLPGVGCSGVKGDAPSGHGSGFATSPTRRDPRAQRRRKQTKDLPDASNILEIWGQMCCSGNQRAEIQLHVYRAALLFVCASPTVLQSQALCHTDGLPSWDQNIDLDNLKVVIRSAFPFRALKPL